MGGESEDFDGIKFESVLQSGRMIDDELSKRRRAREKHGDDGCKNDVGNATHGVGSTGARSLVSQRVSIAVVASNTLVDVEGVP